MSGFRFGWGYAIVGSSCYMLGFYATARGWWTPLIIGFVSFTAGFVAAAVDGRTSRAT